MTRKELFITNFIASWAATYCAGNYEMACLNGNHDKLKNPPFEDIIYLAELLWQKVEFDLEMTLNK